MKVKFYNKIEDEKLEVAVIVSKHQGKGVYCKHKERSTFEVPGGHRENGESIIEAAKRELYEETGATQFTLKQIGVYSVVREETERFGMLFFAEIKEFGELPNMEIEEVRLFDSIPSNLTYPLIQPQLIQQVELMLFQEGEIEK
jgi:8-oxo-dGTP diphosphatase